VGFGTSLFLIAVGAILDLAVKVHTTGFNLNTIGLILMIVGAIGLVLSLIFWGSWGGLGGYRRVTRVSRGASRGAYGPGVAGAQDTEYVETERRY
jgi:Domain of unknown function (DUF6458)